MSSEALGSDHQVHRAPHHVLKAAETLNIARRNFNEVLFIGWIIVEDHEERREVATGGGRARLRLIVSQKVPHAEPPTQPHSQPTGKRPAYEAELEEATTYAH